MNSLLHNNYSLFDLQKVSGHLLFFMFFFNTCNVTEAKHFFNITDMSSKRKETTEEERKIIINLRKDNYSLRKIGEIVKRTKQKLSKSTIKRQIQIMLI